MKRIIALSICLFLGIGIGWYLGYTRPVAKESRRQSEEYRIVRDGFHLTDAEMADALADYTQHHKEYFEDAKREDEMAATIALASLVKLDQGDISTAKRRLETAISIYYRGHRHDGNTNVLRHIVTFAATNAALSNAIYRKLE